jgi:aspartate kinase
MEPSMKRIACKFGGSSLADAAQFRKVQAIVAANPQRRLVVPSAPGKRNKSDAKLTDLLLLCHQSAGLGSSFTQPFEQLAERFLTIERELGVDAQMKQHLQALQSALLAGTTSDYVASRGEYLSGRLLSALLGAEFVDPAECVSILPNGGIDPATYEQLASRIADPKLVYVIPGFYGHDSKGQIKTFSRGGSDISGAIVARAGNAVLYENWTDVSGLLMADPRIVENPKSMQEVTYAEIRELSYMGASVLHDEAIAPVREKDIPLNIRNTNAPDHPGTRIVAQLSSQEKKATEIAGIAGKKNFAMFNLTKSLMNKELGFGYRLLGILQHHNISYEHCPSAIDSISVIVEASQLDGKVEQVMKEMGELLKPDQLEYVPEIALIAVVGEDMAASIGIAAKLFIALRDAQVNVRVINQGSSELNIIVGVSPADYERAVNAIYRAFVA